MSTPIMPERENLVVSVGVTQDVGGVTTVVIRFAGAYPQQAQPALQAAADAMRLLAAAPAAVAAPAVAARPDRPVAAAGRAAVPGPRRGRPAMRPSAARLREALTIHNGNVQAVAEELGAAASSVYGWASHYRNNGESMPLRYPRSARPGGGRPR